MNQYLRFLRPEFMLTPQVFVAVLTWSTFLHLLDLTNNPFAQIPERILILFIVTSAVFGFIAIFSALLRGRFGAENDWRWLVPVTVIASIARGVVLSNLLQLIEYPSTATVLARVTVSIYAALFGLWASTITLGIVRTHAVNRASLLAEQRRLLLVKRRADEDLKDLDEGLTESIQRDLNAALEQLQQPTGQQTLQNLRALIDEVVRPLSHYLQKRSATWELPAFEVESARVKWVEVLRSSLRAERIRPVANTLVLVIAGVPSLARNHDIVPVLLTAGAAVLVGVAMFSATRTLVTKWTAGTGDTIHALAFVASMALTGFFLGMTSFPLAIDEPQPYALALVSTLFTPFGGALVAMAISGNQQLQSIEEQISKATEDLAWETARTRSFYRQRHRSLTHALHGQVQAALSAAYIRLNQLASNELAMAAEFPKVREDLRAVFAGITSAPEAVEDCQSVVNKVAANWMGVAEVDFEISAEAQAIVEQDLLARTVLVDLIPELSFNAVKHGGASEIHIAIAKSGPRAVLLSVCNNGEDLKLTGRRGLGTQLLDECSLRWERIPNPTGSGICVRAEIPAVSA